MSDELRVTRGDDRTLDIDVSDPESGPVDLRDFEGIWFTAKRRVSDPDADAIIRKGLGADLAVDGTVHSRASVNILASDTAALPDRVVRLVWDVQVKDADGRIATVASGSLAVYPDLTRAPREVVAPVLVPPVPETDGDVLTVVGGIPVWAQPTGGGSGTGVSTVVFDVAYADLVLEDEGGLLVDAEADYASVGRADVTVAIPDQAIILGATLEAPEAWAIVDPGFDPDSFQLGVALGPTFQLALFLAAVSPLASLPQFAAWALGGPLPLTRHSSSQAVVSAAAELSLLVIPRGLVAGNERALLADLAPQGTLRITLFYLSAP